MPGVRSASPVPCPACCIAVSQSISHIETLNVFVYNVLMILFSGWVRWPRGLGTERFDGESRCISVRAVCTRETGKEPPLCAPVATYYLELVSAPRGRYPTLWPLHAPDLGFVEHRSPVVETPQPGRIQCPPCAHQYPVAETFTEETPRGPLSCDLQETAPQELRG